MEALYKQDHFWNYISHGYKLRFFTATEFSPPRREERQDNRLGDRKITLGVMATWRLLAKFMPILSIYSRESIKI